MRVLFSIKDQFYLLGISSERKETFLEGQEGRYLSPVFSEEGLGRPDKGNVV